MSFGTGDIGSFSYQASIEMSTLRDIQNEMWDLKDALDAVKSDPMFGALLDDTRDLVLSVRPDDDDD